MTYKAYKTEPYVINIGPHHPSTHGVFRMRMTLDGEVVVEMEPMVGYQHRGHEYLAERRTYTQNIPLSDRQDYLAVMLNNMGYVMAVEKLAGITVSERAEYLRVIVAELQRIASHLLGVGAFFLDLGFMATPFLYMFREREKILDLLEMLCGQRLNYNYMRVGGLSHDAPPEFWDALKDFGKKMPVFIDEYDTLVTENEIFLARTKGVGILTREQAINSSAAGPVLRGSNVKWDIRRADPYSVYDRFEFEIPVGKIGDSYDRYRVRIEEMRQSVRIIKQAMEQIPPGEVKSKVPLRLRPPVGEAYVRVEGAKGELGYYMVSDGSSIPYRMHIRSPSLINLTTLRDLIIGWKVADAIIIFGSIDITVNEVDR